MIIQTLTQFLMWCSILNVGLLLFSFLIFVFAGDWVYRMHTRWFPMPRESFNVAIYTILRGLGGSGREWRVAEGLLRLPLVSLRHPLRGLGNVCRVLVVQEAFPRSSPPLVRRTLQGLGRISEHRSSLWI